MKASPMTLLAALPILGLAGAIGWALKKAHTDSKTEAWLELRDGTSPLHKKRKPSEIHNDTHRAFVARQAGITRAQNMGGL